MNARRLAYCRPCGAETPQAYVGSEHGTPRDVTYWRCTVCGHSLITYADVIDAQGFSAVMAQRWLKGAPSDVDREEVLAVAETVLWAAYLTWRPDSGVRFRAYATSLIPQRLTDWLRSDRGWSHNWRTGEALPGKAHVRSVSVDDDERGRAHSHRLDGVIAGSGGRHPEDRSAVLLGVLARRDSDVLRAERELGIVSAA